MQIKRIDIDIQFPLELINKIEKLNSEKEFSPIWQSINWNLMLQRTQYIVKGIFIWVFDDNNLVNFVIIEKRWIGLNKYANFVVGWLNNKFVNLIEEELIKLWKEEKVIFTQIESLEDCVYTIFKHWVYKKFIEKCTAIINLLETNETILSLMKPKWRYNIKVAEKHSVVVKKVDNNQNNLRDFYNLLSETKTRDNFSVNSESYFKEFLNYLYSNNIWWLYFATKDSILIAAWIFAFYNNTAYYYYWASTTDNDKRKYMATYLLQWKLIEEAKDVWMKNYDFLWINFPWCNSQKLAGVTDFKLKLTSNIKIWPESVIYVHRYFIFEILKLKQFVKKILGK